MNMDKKFDPRKRKKLNNPQRVADLAGLKSGGHYLAVGASTGYLSQAVGNREPVAIIHAVDIEQLMITEMENHKGDGRLDIKLMTGEILPFEDNSMDGLWSITVFHEFSNAPRMLRKP